MTEVPNPEPPKGSKDGDGAADNDKEYVRMQVRVGQTGPFTLRQQARLMVLKSRIADTDPKDR